MTKTPNGGSNPGLTWHHDAAIKLFDHVEGQVRLADQKAGLLFAADSVLLAGYLSILNQASINVAPSGIRFLIVGSAVLATVAVLMAILFVLLSIDPVHKLDPYDQPQVFFKQIAEVGHNKNATDYVNNFLALSQERFTKQLLGSIHGKSDWASKKLREINRAVRCTFASVAFAAIAGLCSFAVRF